VKMRSNFGRAVKGIIDDGVCISIWNSYGGWSLVWNEGGDY